MMGCDAPRPMAAPITLTLALSHQGRGDTICYALPPVRPRASPARFTSFARAPLRFAKGAFGL